MGERPVRARKPGRRSIERKRTFGLRPNEELPAFPRRNLDQTIEIF